MEGFRPAVIEKLFVANTTRILNLGPAIGAATKAAAEGVVASGSG